MQGQVKVGLGDITILVLNISYIKTVILLFIVVFSKPVD